MQYAAEALTKLRDQIVAARASIEIDASTPDSRGPTPVELIAGAGAVAQIENLRRSLKDWFDRLSPEAKAAETGEAGIRRR